MMGYIIGSVVGLYFLIGFIRAGLCWPAVRSEMTRRTTNMAEGYPLTKVEWILPRWLSYLIWSSAWFMWSNEYKDMRISSKLERLSARTRNKPS